jgi:hypothetical protein
MSVCGSLKFVLIEDMVFSVESEGWMILLL